MPSKSSGNRRDNPAQSDAFIKKAHELEADQERSRADDVIGRMAKMKPDRRSKSPPEVGKPEDDKPGR